MAIIRKGDKVAEGKLADKAKSQEQGYNIRKKAMPDVMKKRDKASGETGARKAVASSNKNQDARSLKSGAVGPVSGAALAKEKNKKREAKNTAEREKKRR